jgi:hypothetical protein
MPICKATELPMKRFHFSVAASMGVVLLLALGLAALRANTVMWASVVFTAVVSLFSTAIVAAIAIRGPGRFTWVGMAVFGWIYLAIAFGPWAGGTADPPPFITSWLLDYFKGYILTGKNEAFTYQIQVTETRANRTRFEGIRGPAPPPGGYKNIGSITPFVQASHCVGGVLFGILGAVVGHFISARSGHHEII